MGRMPSIADPASPRTAGSPCETADATTDAAWRALTARDPRFDGRLFVGVTTTGIYCRPVCRVRTPLRRHCRFFAQAAAAERAGFRPCLRCRPELAPGWSTVDAPRALAAEAARLIDRAVAEGEALPIPTLAARLGITDRHLRRIFQAAHGVSPGDWLGTRRLLLAKQLLTDTDLPITQVALASGFRSLRRFHAAFAERYRLQPGALRRAVVAPGPAEGSRGTRAPTGPVDGVTVRLAYRPPYDVAGVLHLLHRRALAGQEAVDLGARRWRRTLGWRDGDRRLAGWIDARFLDDRPVVAVTVSASLVSVLPRVLQRVREALDLDADPAAIETALADLPAPPVAGIRVPGAVDGFEAAARVVLGQQVTVAAARTLAHRLQQAFGEPVDTPWADLDRRFPDAATLAAASPDAIGQLGIVRQRVGALQAVSRAVTAGDLALHPGAPLAPTLDVLRSLPGVGEWTAQLIALRALAWPDAFPASDLGVLVALTGPLQGRRDAAAAEALSQAWRPWRAYAVMRLWRGLDPPPGETAAAPQDRDAGLTPATASSVGPTAHAPAIRRDAPTQDATP
jgi:AraC family transcriptional regulator of adaptative response / DNA-3-methyladenine glycosylase II